MGVSFLYRIKVYLRMLGKGLVRLDVVLLHFPETLLGLFSDHSGSGGFVLKSPSEVRSFYEQFLSGTHLDFYKANNTLTRLKRETTLQLLPSYYGSWMSDSKEACEISFKPHHLSQPSMNTHVLIYEGARDVLLRDSRHFQLLDLQNKYNAKVDFVEFPSKVRRSDRYMGSNFTDVICEVSNMIQSESGPVLVVTWMNSGDSRNAPGCREFVEKVDSELQKKGIGHDRYKITYFGARRHQIHQLIPGFLLHHTTRELEYSGG